MIKNRPQPLIFIILTVAAASSISMIGGTAIELVADKLLPLIPLIIALPALNTMVGDYATIVSSYEEIGINHKMERSLYLAVAKSVAVNILSVVALSISIAVIKNYDFDVEFVLTYVGFIAFATIATVTAIAIISKILYHLLSNRKMNAEDILIPVITSVTDVLMLVMISVSTVTIFR